MNKRLASKLVTVLAALLILIFGGKGIVPVPQMTDSDSASPATETVQEESTQQSDEPLESSSEEISYVFRNEQLLNEHYEKHGIEMGFASAAEYEKAASAVINHPSALHKQEKEDNDDVYYLESSNEFVIVSTDGYIRTYFSPDSGIHYYNKQ